jgi:RNA polymerase sigma factor (sigma-70 family)
MAADRSRAARAYDQLCAPVLGYLRGLGVPDAEDALGEVFLQVVRDITRFRGDEAALRRWVFSIAHNRAMDSHRRGRRSPAPLPSVRDVPPPDEPFDDELLEALERLTLDQREVVVLRFVADLSIDSVAQITSRTVGATKALQHRALERLRRTLCAETAER